MENTQKWHPTMQDAMELDLSAVLVETRADGIELWRRSYRVSGSCSSYRHERVLAYNPANGRSLDWHELQSSHVPAWAHVPPRALAYLLGQCRSADRVHYSMGAMPGPDADAYDREGYCVQSEQDCATCPLRHSAEMDCRGTPGADRKRFGAEPAQIIIAPSAGADNREGYCEHPPAKCAECSLSSYGRDCRNQSY